MDKHSVDFSNLNKKFHSPKVYKLADVQHLIQKVAFDVVRFRDNEDTTQLWKIEESVDGPVIVAMYEVPKDSSKVSEASAKVWEVIADGSSNINIFYKGEAVRRVKASDIGCSEDEIPMMCRWLPNKLASDSSIKQAMLKDMPKESKELLLSKYPELKG